MNLNIKNINTFKSFQKALFQKKSRFVSFRKPMQNDVITFIDTAKETIAVNNFDTLENEKGFIMSPYGISAKTPAYIVNPEWHAPNLLAWLR